MRFHAFGVIGALGVSLTGPIAPWAVAGLRDNATSPPLVVLVAEPGNRQSSHSAGRGPFHNFGHSVASGAKGVGHAVAGGAKDVGHSIVGGWHSFKRDIDGRR
jgi:hypothetical protein